MAENVVKFLDNYSRFQVTFLVSDSTFVLLFYLTKFMYMNNIRFEIHTFRKVAEIASK